mgnify:CR=1 FL=1
MTSQTQLLFFLIFFIKGDEELNRLNPIKVNSVEEYDKPRQELINPLPNKVSLVVSKVEKTDNKNAAKSNVIATDSSGLEEPDLKNEKSVEELEKQYQLQKAEIEKRALIKSLQFFLLSNPHLLL